MDAENFRKLDELEYVMEEIKERLQHLKDLKEERKLMLEDLEVIKTKHNPQNLKLYIDYPSAYSNLLISLEI